VLTQAAAPRAAARNTQRRSTDERGTGSAGRLKRSGRIRHSSLATSSSDVTVSHPSRIVPAAGRSRGLYVKGAERARRTSREQQRQVVLDQTRTMDKVRLIRKQGSLDESTQERVPEHAWR
jgi:hypothetical protein